MIIHIHILDFYLTIERSRQKLDEAAPIVLHGVGEREPILAAANIGGPAGLAPGALLEQARRDAAHARFVRADFEFYEMTSLVLTESIRDRFPFTEQLDLSEWFVDTCGEDTASACRALEGDLTKTYPFRPRFGVAPSKFVSKLLNDLQPAATPHDMRAWLNETPLDRLWGVPRESISVLKRLGLENIGEVGGLKEELLELELREFPGLGAILPSLCRGEDTSPVQPFSRPSRLSNSARVPANEDMETRKKMLERLVNKLAHQLGESGYAAGCVQIEVKGQGQHVLSRRHQFYSPSDAAREILEGANGLLAQVMAFEKPRGSIELNVILSQISYARDAYQLRISRTRDSELELL